MWLKTQGEDENAKIMKCECNMNIIERVNQNVMKWFGNVESMSNERSTKRMYMAEVGGNKGRWKPQSSWR